MGRAVLIKCGGGGISSDDLTATLADVFNGKTAVTSDSNDEPGTGTGKSFVGGTYTPSSSTQTINCANCLCEENIIIGAIPATYVNPSQGQSVGW